MDSKIKQEHTILLGENLRRLRLAQKYKTVDIVRKMQLLGFAMTREMYVKIEAGRRHIYASELRALRDILNTTYDALLEETKKHE